MHVTLINGNPENGSRYFEAYVNDLVSTLGQNRITTRCFHLRETHVLSCTGCWGCWVKTPGECLFQDDSKTILKEVVNSDWVIFMSPLLAGFTSALLKKMQDKFIPLVHPYIELVNNECHHEKRYAHYPRLGLVYAREKDTDEEDLDIVSTLYQRFALNFKTELKLFKSIEESTESIAHEINLH